MTINTLKRKNNLLDELFNDSIFNDHLPKISNIPYDIIETDVEYRINLLLAGYRKDDFNLEVEDGELIITGERSEIEDVKYNHKNSFFGKIKKGFTLPKDITINKIDAEYVDGVLMILIPKDKGLIRSKSITVR